MGDGRLFGIGAKLFGQIQRYHKHGFEGLPSRPHQSKRITTSADKFNDQRFTSHERWRSLKSERHAASELGKTDVIVLRDINFASCNSDKIVIMNEGRLAHQGSPASVITSKIMKEIYDINITVHTISGHLISDYYN